MRRLQLHSWVLAGLLVLSLICSISFRSAAVDGKVNTDFSGIPLDFGKWSGVEERFSNSTYSLLPTCSLLLRDYIAANESTKVELAIVYGMDLGDFHQPEYCLEGQGLKAVNEYVTQMPDGRNGKFNAKSLIMVDSDGNRWAFVYWFYTRGKTGTYLGRVKAREVLDRFRGKKLEPSAMVRLATKVVDSDRQSVDRLSRFANDVFPYLEKELSGGAPVSLRAR